MLRDLRFGFVLLLAACAPGALEPSADRADAVRTPDGGTARADGGGRPLVDGGAGVDGDAGDAAVATRLRIVASNLTSGNLQSYDPGEGARILQGLAPDVVLMQELNYGDGTDEALRGFVDRTFGPSFFVTREPGGQIPNGVISRYPIVASGVWDDTQTNSREFSWARIDVPGDKDLWAISVHLLTSSSGDRQAEARTIVTHVQNEIPERDYVVIGGDFNTGSRGEGCVRTFAEITRTTGPYPTDAAGNGNTSRTRSKPLDWVLADRDLDVLSVPVVVGDATFPNGLVFDSRVFRPITAVPPALTTDSNAVNMQHMAVVRDFALPE